MRGGMLHRPRVDRANLDSFHPRVQLCHKFAMFRKEQNEMSSIATHLPLNPGQGQMHQPNQALAATLNLSVHGTVHNINILRRMVGPSISHNKTQ